LTDKQISTLDKHINKFRTADYESWEQIVEDIFQSFESTWANGIEFHEEAVITVCAPFAPWGCSQIFLAYSLAPVQENKTGDRGILSPS